MEEDISTDATAFPAENGEDMSDEEFYETLGQKVAESVSPN